MSTDCPFTEKQLKLLKQAVRIGVEDGSLKEFGSWMEISALQSDIDDFLQFERERKRERKRSLAIERRLAHK